MYKFLLYLNTFQRLLVRYKKKSKTTPMSTRIGTFDNHIHELQPRKDLSHAIGLLQQS